MYPDRFRLKELRDRFDVHHGRFFGDYLYKNLNWYYAKRPSTQLNQAEWFLFGDIREEDIPRLQALLRDDEVLILGWKDMEADVRNDRFGDGGGLCLSFNQDIVLYDKRKSSIRGTDRSTRKSVS